MKKVIIYTSFYALFKDGSYVPIIDLTEIGKLPTYMYIVKAFTYYYDNSTPRSLYYEHCFVDEKGNDTSLKIGDWELVYLSPELREKNVKSEMSYRLFNHFTQTVMEFKRNTPGLDFFKNELFPKMYNENVIILKLEELIQLVKNSENKK